MGGHWGGYIFHWGVRGHMTPVEPPLALTNRVCLFHTHKE